MQLGVLAVEVVLQAVEITGTFPFAHGEVVEQVVAAGLGLGGGDFGLGEYPLETLDGQAAHVLDGVLTRHDDIHAGETAHGTYIDNVLLDRAVAEPGGHEVFQAMHGCWSNGGLLVGLGDAQVECGEAFVFA